MTLSLKQQTLAHIAAQTAWGEMGQLTHQLNQAFDAGWTANELQAALVHLSAYLGFPRSLNALTALRDCVRERQNAGLPTPEGNTATRLPENSDWLAQGTQTQTDLVGQAVDLSQLSPEIDRFLKSHLFGEIFANDLLNWQEREILTIAALAQLKGVDSQLQGHIQIGLRNGLTQADIQALLTLSPATSKAMSVFPAGEENTAYAQYFDGTSYLKMLSLEQVTIGNVTFEPSCRNHWHIHHASQGGGQMLLVTAGRGYYQEWGKPAQALKAGNIVHIPAGVKHWHGAAPTAWFQHLAIEVAGENTRTEWCEPVDEAEYQKLA